MIGTMDYTRCSNSSYAYDHCQHACGWCNDHMLIRPQCFACIHFRQRDTSCSIHGQLPDAVGCCGLYVRSPLEYCINGWAHRRDWGLDCGLVDTIGCELCQAEYFALIGEAAG